ncbi:MAG: flagellar basal-body rod protein FlgF [Candidatus Zixiibacteriota bacterium]
MLNRLTENYMIKGMYTSASGMIPRVKKQELVANNVANAATAGYKKDAIFIRELSKAEQKLTPKQTDWQKPMVNETYVDYTPGTFDRTDNPLDLAIDGDGFFRLQDQDGNEFLTRSGTFQVDNAGFLSYPGGFRVIGESGPLLVGNGAVNVGQGGEIEVDGNQTGRIIPMTVDNMDKLEKVGGSLFRVPDGVQTSPAANAMLRQGYLETSNVDIVREMVDMMIAYRTYETNAKALQVQDESLDTLFKRVAGNG